MERARREKAQKKARKVKQTKESQEKVMETKKEIERKFLVSEADLSGIDDIQLYSIESVYLDLVEMGKLDPQILSSPSREIRVSRVEDSDGVVAYWSVSKTGGHKLIREEAQIEISEEDYKKAVERFGSKKVAKKRFKFPYNGNFFELDVFSDKELVLMEIELRNPRQLFEIPPFVHVVKDVTGISDFYNSSLATEIVKE